MAKQGDFGRYLLNIIELALRMLLVNTGLGYNALLFMGRCPQTMRKWRNW